ncbi:hypothetical protein O3P69_014465 [Scylla paramamosain]|uniref:Ionotropic glutamate receptor L-glutamate and glycine-binding domain-containing protein n=1 Tax=Scylla paramamosain TaxID=85552 RepID=A0AAW0TC61_SCYPA
MMRCSNQPTTYRQRATFVSMWISGMSTRAIAKETCVSPSTVCRWINRWQQEGNVENHKPISKAHHYRLKKSVLKTLVGSAPWVVACPAWMQSRVFISHPAWSYIIDRALRFLSAKNKEEGVMRAGVALLLAAGVLSASFTALPQMEGLPAVEAVAPILTTDSPCDHTAAFLTHTKQEGEAVRAPRGVVVLQVQDDKGNTTETQLTVVVDQIRKMGEAWHCLVVVVVSDDPAFLAAFAHLSLRRHALRWSTRILVLTHLPLSYLGGLHGLLSNRNAMLLLTNVDMTHKSRVYVWLPYSSKPVEVATWTPHGRLTLAPDVALFPDKFSVFSSAPALTAAIEVLPHNRISWLEDPDVPSGRRLLYSGYVDNIVRHFAKALNFTYRYVLSPERTFGTRLPDGSWTGLMGMVVREEVDFSPGPFINSLVRSQAADHTTAFYIGNVRIIAGLTGLEVDPWGFVLPLTALVWVATLTALLGVITLLYLISSILPSNMMSANTFSPVRVLLQQGEGSGSVLGPSCRGLSCVLKVSVLSGSSSRALMKTNSASLTPNADVVWPAEWWWWERLVLGLWMLTTLVLTKSYAGNLMSLLAVRYVPQPFQTLRDVLDHPSVVMIWQKLSSYEQYIREARSGVYHEVAQLEDNGRLKFHTQSQIRGSLDTLVRAGHHVVIDVDISLRSRIALDFSEKGEARPTTARVDFIKLACAVFLSIIEQGLISYWMENVPNISECENVPKKKLLTSSISIRNIWGMFVVLAGGLGVALVTLGGELLLALLSSRLQ